MIIDSLEAPDTLIGDAAVCIIGSGAAGITLACEFDRCNFKVLLLEAGESRDSASSPDYYKGAATAPHPAAEEYRRVGLGGTTSIWGGRCVPLDPIDFERRDYIANSGWPISYDEVARFYPQALNYCDAGVFDFTARGSITSAAPTISNYSDRRIVDSDLIERYSLPTNFGTRYRDKLEASKNLVCLTGARVVELGWQAGEQRISSVQIVQKSGARRTLKPAHIIVAAGGIESTRLLLASDAAGLGIGNRFDLLGRYYACHIQGVFARLVPNGAQVMFDFERTREGVYCRRKLQFSPDAQREHALRNTAFRLHFPEYSDAAHGSAAMSAIYLAKSFLIKEYRNILQQKAGSRTSPRAEHLRNILFGVPQLLKFSSDWLFKRQLAMRKLPYTLIANKDGSYPLEFNCEQTPTASSRITLLAQRDAHGMRRVSIDWYRDREDIAAVERSFKLLRDTLKAGSSCRVEFSDDLSTQRLDDDAPVGGHHIGTTRMASTPREGVVDTNCAVFDFPNLYVASSAVFPTSSHANPTLTIVALALRLAQHLKSKLEPVS